MKNWECIDFEAVPNDKGTMFLMSRGSEYVIQVDGKELMSNRQHGSEDAHADLACDLIQDLSQANILVGGLGMGFTLAAVLRRLGQKGNVTVAELVPAVVRWQTQFVGKAARYPLRDKRVKVYNGDVADLIEKPPTLWSVILLDVDNGPMSLTRPYNGWLYTYEGLRAAYDALTPGGVLGIWSVAPDDVLTDSLINSGFKVDIMFYGQEDRKCDPEQPTHVLWTAQRP